jgi:hypothetical protein
MRRVLFGLAVTAVTVLAFAGPASAASGQVTHFRFHGLFAESFWFTSTATSYTDSYINVQRTKQGPELYVDHFVGHLDQNGNFTGGTDTTADVFSGFSFAIDQKKLATASTSGSGLPATTCTIDANGNPTNCHSTTINVTAAWIGQGPITRSVANDHSKAPGFSFNDHFNGTDRNAAVTAAISGATLKPADLQYADLGTTNSGSVTVCRGTGC